MNRLYAIIIFLVFISACNQIYEQKDINMERYIPLKTSKQIYDSLYSAITKHDERALERLFNDWQASYQPNNKEEISRLQVTIEIFDLFRSFYGSTNKMFYKEHKSEYSIIQNELKYGIAKSRNLKKIDPDTFRLDTISNFRPRVNINESKILYFTFEYDNAFQIFLNMRDSVTFRHQIMRDNSQFNMLRKLCPIASGTVDFKYYLNIDPYISSIIFNRNLTKARIDCMLQNYMGYAFIYKKIGDKWVLQERFETWII